MYENNMKFATPKTRKKFEFLEWKDEFGGREIIDNYSMIL